MENILFFMFESLFFDFQRIAVPRVMQLSRPQRRDGVRQAFSLLREKGLFIVFQVVIFLILIQAMAFVTRARPFAKLDADAGEGVLRKFYDSPIALIRKGFWGLNTLAKLSVYGQEEIYPLIHYHIRELVRD